MRTRSLRALALVAATTAIVLGVPAPVHADLSHNPVANCQPPVQFTDQPLVAVFYGEAHVPSGHAPFVESLTVTCSYIGPGVSFQVRRTSSSPVVTAYQAHGLFFSAFDTICQSAEVVYTDGHVATTSPVCREGALSFSANPGPTETPYLLRCDHTRGPSLSHTWIVAASAVASARDVPFRTQVSCTLRASNGEITAGATSLGGVAAATDGGIVAIDRLVSKCYSMTVEYLTAGSTSSSVCEYF